MRCCVDVDDVRCSMFDVRRCETRRRGVSVMEKSEGARDGPSYEYARRTHGTVARSTLYSNVTVRDKKK